jgi:hypothetical protein
LRKGQEKSYPVGAPGNRVCNKKTSKFFVSRQEESMAGHMDIKEVY